MEKVTIVMLSGGVDSTYALYQVLKETDDVVFAHHINFLNREKRYNPELQASLDVVKYLSDTVRDFDFSFSTFQFPFTHIGWDAVTAFYIGALISKNFASDERDIQICLGDNKDDVDHDPAGVFQNVLEYRCCHLPLVIVLPVDDQHPDFGRVWCGWQT